MYITSESTWTRTYHIFHKNLKKIFLIYSYELHCMTHGTSLSLLSRITNIHYHHSHHEDTYRNPPPPPPQQQQLTSSSLCPLTPTAANHLSHRRRQRIHTGRLLLHDRILGTGRSKRPILSNYLWRISRSTSNCINGSSLQISQ